MTTPKCPKCGKPIGKLFEVFLMEHTIEMRIERADWMTSQPIKQKQVGKTDYICPKCKQVLTHSGLRAGKILGFYDLKWTLYLS